MNSVVRTILIGLGIALACPSTLFVTPARAIEPGAHVRATFADSTYGAPRVLRRSGDLLHIDAETVTLQPAHAKDPLVLKRRDIKALEVRTAESEMATGALTGLVIGAAAGAIIGYSAGDDPESQWFGLSAGQKATAMGALFAPLGALLGAIAAPGEQWQKVPDDQIQLGWGGSARGDGVVFLSLRF